jgi:hypothetical protein
LKIPKIWIERWSGIREALKLCPPLENIYVITEKSVFLVNNSRTAERYEETKWKPKGSQQPHLRQLSSCHLPIHIHPDQQPQKNQLNHHEERNRDNHVNHAHKPAQTARLSSQEDQDLNKNIHMTLYNFAIVLPFNIIRIFFLLLFFQSFHYDTFSLPCYVKSKV